ncbi:dual specificity protein phosphatase 3-like [Amphiura filiformis]|uniref:dual specificity protein phosphatase 3-like n=1 Tax=Amphiura filiformis TaxID=82378 RepID=UPI003B2153C5
MATKPAKKCLVEELDALCLGRAGVVLFPSTSYNEVYPNIYISDRSFAENKSKLTEVGITHVVNAAQMYTVTDEEFYKGIGIKYHGMDCDDREDFNILPYLKSASEYIHQAMTLEKGKVLVHCLEGYSRSPTIVIAYLMMYKTMDVYDAVRTVKRHREIRPNQGFLQTLCVLDDQLQEQIDKH